MAFLWRVDNGPKLNAGLVALCIFRRSGPVMLRNPKFLCFSRGVHTPCPPSGSAHAMCILMLPNAESTKILCGGPYSQNVSIFLNGYHLILKDMKIC